MVDLLRHGEPVGGRRYRGQTDDPLSEKGWSQMRAAIGDRHDWQVIVSSPLSRCAAFARELSARHDIPLETDARLKEIGFGEWEGRTPEELASRDAGLLARFLDDPIANAPDGAEALADFRARIAAAWDDLLARHGGKRVLLVGHAGVVRMVMSLVLDIPLARVFRMHVPNAALTRIRVERAGARVFPQLLFHAAQP
jgi:alpha-ribazole phosphatase/probable phosphoglycerate mutase